MIKVKISLVTLLLVAVWVGVAFWMDQPAPFENRMGRTAYSYSPIPSTPEGITYVVRVKFDPLGLGNALPYYIPLSDVQHALAQPVDTLELALAVSGSRLWRGTKQEILAAIIDTIAVRPPPQAESEP